MSWYIVNVRLRAPSAGVDLSIRKGDVEKVIGMFKEHNRMHRRLLEVNLQDVREHEFILVVKFTRVLTHFDFQFISRRLLSDFGWQSLSTLQGKLLEFMISPITEDEYINLNNQRIEAIQEMSGVEPATGSPLTKELRKLLFDYCYDTPDEGDGLEKRMASRESIDRILAGLL